MKNKKININIGLTDPDDQKSWDKLVNHPLQSWAWGEFRKKMGVDLVRNIAIDKGTYQLMQLTFHYIPHTPYTIGYFPKGPLPTKSMLQKLTEIAKQKNAIFIQLEPNVIENFKLKIENYGLLPSHHPLFTKHTFILDLTKSEDELMKAMHPKTRYNIRLAQKHGVSIRQNNTPEAFAAYLRLSEETTKRQKFYAHNPTYHKTMYDMLGKEKIATLWTAQYQNEILTAWILFVWKNTIYYPYGASSRNHREVMAPNLLLWEIIKWGKRNGYKKLDLWGALGPSKTGLPDPDDPWFGFHKFKEGYHPDLAEFIGSYDLVVRPALYRIFCFIDDIRRLFLRMR